MSAELIPSDRAPGALVAPGVEIPDDADLAPYVTIHAGVELGEGVTLEQGAIVGRPQQIHGRSRSPSRPPGQATMIGEGCRVGSYAVVVAGARIGAESYLGDFALVREAAVLGDKVVIGRGSTVSRDTEVGSRTRIHNSSIIAPWTHLEDSVVIGPFVTTLTDPTMGRRPTDAKSGGILVRRASRIGTGSIIFPPVEIGEEAVVGAATVVRDDVPARTVVAGVPARTLREVREDELIDEWPE